MHEGMGAGGVGVAGSFEDDVHSFPSIMLELGRMELLCRG